MQQRLRVGEPFAYSLCLGREVAAPQPGQAGLDPALAPCGGDLNPSPYVSGGNPPYHFQLDSGWGFPPMGLILDINGVLRGTPSSDRAATFRVCAVDMSETSGCQLMTLQPQPAVGTPPPQQQETPKARQRSGRSGPNTAAIALIGGVALAAGVAAVAIAAGSTSDSGGCSAGQTDCADGHCCEAGYGCCGLYGDSEKCCSASYPHYCPSTDKCYQTMPSCDFTVCGGVVANMRGVAVGAGPIPGALRPGDPRAVFEAGIPSSSCRIEPKSAVK